MNLDSVIGKYFKDSEGMWYGPMRSIGIIPKPIGDALAAAESTPFATDSCGNYFVLTPHGIAFWDHETDDLKTLSLTNEDFIANVFENAPEVSFKPGMVVISSWEDPNFKPEFD